MLLLRLCIFLVGSILMVSSKFIMGPINICTSKDTALDVLLLNKDLLMPDDYEEINSLLMKRSDSSRSASSLSEADLMSLYVYVLRISVQIRFPNYKDKLFLDFYPHLHMYLLNNVNQNRWLINFTANFPCIILENAHLDHLYFSAASISRDSIGHLTNWKPITLENLFLDMQGPMFSKKPYPAWQWHGPDDELIEGTRIYGSSIKLAHETHKGPVTSRIALLDHCEDDDVLGDNFVIRKYSRPHYTQVQVVPHGNQVASATIAIGKTKQNTHIPSQVVVHCFGFFLADDETRGHLLNTINTLIQESYKISIHPYQYRPNSILLRRAFRKLSERDHLIITAAGQKNLELDVAVNVVGAPPTIQEGDDENEFLVFPGALEIPNIINVAASTKEGLLMNNSNYGQRRVDLLAPGERILANNAKGVIYVSGTSIAAGVAAGIIGLLRGQIRDSDYNSTAFRSIIDDSCYKIDIQGANARCGGILDFYRGETLLSRYLNPQPDHKPINYPVYEDQYWKKLKVWEAPKRVYPRQNNSLDIFGIIALVAVLVVVVIIAGFAVAPAVASYFGISAGSYSVLSGASSVSSLISEKGLEMTVFFNSAAEVAII